MNGEIEWPREIWMAERDDHDQGINSGCRAIKGRIRALIDKETTE